MRKTIHVAAAVIEKEEVILIARRLKGEFAGYWEFPGGKYEAGESGPEALQREIREEFECAIEIREKLCTIRHRYQDFDLLMDCYICSLAEEDLILHDHSAIRWIRAAERGIDWVPADRKVIREYRKRIKEK